MSKVEQTKLLEEKCKKFAEDVLFSGGNLNDLLTKHELELRPKKDIESVRSAIQRGRKQGNKKVEFEITMIGAALEKQFKLKEEKK